MADSTNSPPTGPIATATATSTTTTITATIERPVKTRILIVSDTHNAMPARKHPQLHHHRQHQSLYGFREPLPTADILLHAGDLTMSGRWEEHVQTVTWLRSAPAELKIVIPGNHDVTLDRRFYLEDQGFMARRWRRQHAYTEADLDRIRDLYCGAESRAAGIEYVEEGLRTFQLRGNGARFTVYASAYQPEFCNWAFPYEREVDRFNPPPDPQSHREMTGGNEDQQRQQGQEDEKEKVGPANPIPSYPAVDIVLTHGPPLHILDATHRGEDVGCAHLGRALARCRPRLHAFGHIHEARGAAWMEWSKPKPNPDPNLTSRHRSSGEENEGKEEEDDDDENEGGEVVTPMQGQQLQNGATYLDISSSRASASVTDNDNDPIPNPHPASSPSLEFGRHTLFINASIMNLQYRPLNPPWLVDLDLPL